MNRERIRTVCREYSFRIADVRSNGDVLVLQPEDLEDLPDPDTLSSLASRLSDEFGWQHVSLDTQPA